MKFISLAAILFSVSVMAQQEYVSSTVYSKSPCTSSKLIVVAASTESGDTSTCKQAQDTVIALANTTSCYDISKINPAVSGFYGTIECFKEDPEAWPKMSFVSTKYLANLLYLDTKCRSIIAGVFIAADGTCYSMVNQAVGTSYRVTANTGDSYTMDHYKNTPNCAGTPETTKFRSSDLSQSCIPASGFSVKVYVSSGIRNAISLIALGSVVFFSMLLAFF